MPVLLPTSLLPRIGSRRAIGIDISDNTVEMVELGRRLKGIELVHANRIKVPDGVVVGGRVQDAELLSEVIKQVLARKQKKPVRLRNVQVGLPDSQVYVHVFELESQKKKEMEKNIFDEVRKSIPIEPAELVYSTRILREQENKMDIVLVATRRTVVLEWWELWQSLGVQVKQFDVEALAIWRGLRVENSDVSTVVVDMGAATSNIAIFDNIGLRVTHSVPIAGDALTQTIASSANIDVADAERQKISVGLQVVGKEYDVAVKKLLDRIIKEIETLRRFYQHKDGQEISQIMLVGGSSQLPGLVDYFTERLGPVSIGQAVLGAENDNLYYIGAIGLALRGLDRRWNRTDPVVTYGDWQVHGKDTAEKPAKNESTKMERTTLRSNDDNQKIRRQKFVLIGLLLVGVVMVVLAFWYRQQEKRNQVQELNDVVVSYSAVQDLQIDVPLAVDESEYTDDRAQGRKMTVTVQGAGDFAEAQAIARIEAEAELAPGEVLWSTPISSVQSEFPMTIEWIVYMEDSVNALLEARANQTVDGRAPFEISNIEKTGLKTTANDNVFSIESTVTITLESIIDELVDEPVAGDLDEEDDLVDGDEEDELVKIEVLETPTNILNVRDGPDITAVKINEILPGEEYTWLDEADGWIQIDLDDEGTGWVSNEYVRIRE